MICLNEHNLFIAYIITLGIAILYYVFRLQNQLDVLNPSEQEIKEVLNKLSGKKKLYERTLDDERVFMEDLLVKRFHFLIIMFSIFFGGASMNLDDNMTKSTVLLVGSIFCFIVSRIVKRAHHKHHWIMRVLYGKDLKYDNQLSEWENHPVKIINDAMEQPLTRKKRTKSSVSLWNGYLLPNLSVAVLLISSIYFGLKHFLSV